MDAKLNESCSRMVEELSTLTSLTKKEIKKISGFFDCRTVSENEVLWKEGDKCGYVGFIAFGRVKISKETEFKGNRVVLGIYGAGSFIGALCILDNSPRAVTAETMEETSLMIITKENFNKLMNAHPELWGKLIKGMLISVSKRLKSSFDRLITVF